MINLPIDFAARYIAFLSANGIEQSQHRFYLKWLRYYLDFCTKYSFKWSENDSLSAFLIKLKNKNQQPFMLEQAKKAVELLWKMESSKSTGERKAVLPKEERPAITCNQAPKEIKNESPLPSSSNRPSNVVPPTPPEREVVTQEKQSGADWRHIYAELENSIKIRHYSPKTLKSYTIYTKQFQTFVKSKDSRLIGVEDVKGFLTWLAVKKKVSASSQNLAFNALLFLFRNVLKAEFGKVDGVVRAKRRPYIPVVLSREEIDDEGISVR
jgi:hypothetical protein